jgi:glutaminyl-peptide cyclotransferase
MRAAPKLAVASIALLVALVGAFVVLVGAAFDSSQRMPDDSQLSADRFDSARAFAELRYQVELGPRPAGSDTARRLAEWLRKRLPRGRIETVPGGWQNVVGDIPGRGKAILVAAHYDTKDLPGFVGANDGAGGTAAVLEIARAIARVERPANAPPIHFALFDGEESPDDSQDFYTSGLRGSKPYARRHAHELRAMVLLDFVAEADDMLIPREESSDIGLWARLRAAARRVGAQRVFPDVPGPAVIDDHTPFLRRGVPAIDLIDFTFDCWHKPCDDMTAVSELSLDLVGETVVQMLLDVMSGEADESHPRPSSANT